MKPIQDQHQTSHSSGDAAGCGPEISQREDLVKTALTEPHWEHEASKRGLILVLKKGAVILALFAACALLNTAKTGLLIPTLIFVAGTAIIVLWPSADSPTSD